MQKGLLKEYAKLEDKFKALEAKRQVLREEIVEDMQKNKLDKVESDYGNFTIAVRKSWTYSEAVQKIVDRLKIAKGKEEQKGIATSTETPYLLFKVNQD